MLGGTVIIRELLRPAFTAAQAFAETERRNPETGAPLIDPWRWHAAVVAHGLMDPATGRPYEDGRIDPATGQAPIDPATRAALFTPEDVAAWPSRPTIEDGLAALAQAILDLSEPADPKPSPG